MNSENKFRASRAARLSAIHKPGFFYQLQDNRVLPETKYVAIFIIPFLLAAWAILYLLPQRSGDLFAWPIQPPMTARLMGSGYLAGAYFFWRAARAQNWHTIKNGFLPVSLFAGLMFLTTLLHWERFSQGHFAFLTWVTLYATTPVLVLALWLRNRRADPLTFAENDARVPIPVRWAMGLVGGIVAVIALYFYSNPAQMIAIWPWTLTPLTARAALGFFILPAITEIVLALDPRWSAHRTILQGQIFALALILFGAVLSWPDLIPTTRWLFVAGMALLLLANLVYYRTMQRRVTPFHKNS